MTRLRVGLAAGLAVASTLGCASAPRPEEAKEATVLVGSAAAEVLLLPLNITAIMPSEFGAASPAVWEALQRYLREQGAHLKTLAFPAARRLWLASVRKARAGPKGQAAGFEEAARLFVGELSKHAEFDTAILPSLFTQRAQVEGGRASFDGVQRRVEIETAPGVWSTSDEIELVGAAAAVSLHAVVLDAKGDVLQQGQGGLDLLVRVRRRESAAPGGGEAFEFSARPDPLADRAHLREGIAEALAPFFPDLVPEPEDATPR